MLAQIDPNGTASATARDPSPLKESDGLVMGGGEGDEDLGDDAVAATPRSRAKSNRRPTQRASADPAAPGAKPRRCLG